MTDTNTAEREALMDLIDAYAEARHVGGCHTYNAKTAEARAKVVASLAASAGSEPVACNRFAWGRLYDKASILMAVIGRDGEVSSRADEVALLMHALHDVDGGEHMPGLMPAAKLITPAPPVVETSPGSPNFEGGAAYEAYMAADTHPSPPEGAWWISVDERLPEPGQNVAFVVRASSDGAFRLLDGRVLGGRFLPGEGFSVPGLCVDATHWMPLPAPPLPASEAKEL